MVDIARNIRQIRELKNFTQEYMAIELGMTQPAYAQIESGNVVLKIDRLQEIANILQVELSALLNSNTIFNIVFNSTANHSGYINTQHNVMNIDLDMLRKIIREEIEKQNN